MFYQATVVEVKPSHQQLVIKYKSSQGTPNILIDYSKVSKYPEGFNLKSDEDSDAEDSKQSSNASQEQDEDGKASSEGSKKDSDRKISPQEEARIRFMNDQKPNQKEKHDFTPLKDEDFNELAGKRPPNNTITAVKGTPLLDFLEDDLLFPQNAPHITGSGVLRRKNIEQVDPDKSALLKGPVQCGRINKILYEWK